MQIKSFDIFDTCLSRICGEPVNVFHLLGAHITGLPVGSGECNDFVNARVKAEANARKTAREQGREEICLKEIYAHFEGATFSTSLEALPDLELIIEKSVLRPVETALKEVNKAREQGFRICFISDMYLPGEFIREVLSERGFWKENDRLYLSCEYNATKYSGKLFDLVSQKEAVSFKDISHSGDHPVSDYHVPRSKGIEANLVRLHYNRYETDWLFKRFYYTRSPQISMLAGLSRSVRKQKSADKFENILSSVIAPLLVPFVAWVIEDARKRKIRKIFFQARDGYVLYRIAQVLLEGESDLTVSYLYGSRRTFYLPGMYGCHSKMLDWVIKGAEGRTPAEMLKRLSMDSEWMIEHAERKGLTKSFLDRPMTAPDVLKFREMMLDPEVERVIQERAQDAKSLAKRFLVQEGLDDGHVSALVDIGWSRVSQQSVNNILDTQKVFGYFLGVFQDRITASESAGYAAVFYPEDFSQAQYGQVFDSAFVALLEQFYVMTGDPSTIGYREAEGVIKPVFGSLPSHYGNFEQFRKLRDETLLLFAKEYKKLSLGLCDHQMLCKACGLMAGQLFVKEPDMDELKLLRNFRPDQGVDEGITLMRKITPMSMIKEILNRLRGGKPSVTYLWREGSIKYSFGNAGYSVYRFLRDFKKKDELTF